ERFAVTSASATVVARAQLLDVPAASLGEPVHEPFVVDRLGAPRPDPIEGPRVVDLSALWAGPLCARLLRDAGAHITIVESTARPGPHRDADAHIALDFERERTRLLALIDAADVVIEASRPRVLRDMGVVPSPHHTWISITAYGRTDDR